MKLFLLAFLLGSLVGGARAQHADLVTNVHARRTTNLNGSWRTIVDPYETGYYDYRYQPSADPYGRNRKPGTPQDLVEYDFDTAPRLLVPGDWNSQREDLFFYEGTVWYKTAFDYDLAPGRRLFLHFGAANYEAVVYVNGEEVGRHVGGFTPFQFEITERVRPTDNVVVVKVDNQRRREGVPTVNTDWWNYGGLTRDVLLVDVPETFVKDYFVQLDPQRPGEIAGWVRLDGPARRGPVTVALPEAGLTTTTEADADGLAPVRLPAPPERWSAERPTRYRIVVEGGGDRVEEAVGFRTIETRGTDILVNGEPVFLRGISIHEQAPLRDGRAHGEADARVLLGWAKDLGCNFVRLAHYPHNEHMVRVAEEMGLYVWAEVPVYWTILWENEGTLANARQQVREMITRDKNRAAVLLWSVGNETPLSEPRLAFMTQLTALARALDPTRLVTAALERHYVDDQTLMIDDPLGEHLDVLGVNEYVGWYDGAPEKADGLRWETVYDKPLIMSEFGGGALQGHHGREDERWTEEYQRDLYEHQIGMLRKIPFLRGTTPWILADFRSPRRPLPVIQDYWNRKGLLSNHGQRKQAFYVLQAFYEELRRAEKE